MSRPTDSLEPEPAEATVPAAVAESWRRAEAQLFGVLVNAPEVYQRAVTMVGDTVDRLRRLGPSTVALLGAASRLGELVGDGSGNGSASGLMDPDLVGRAALAVRHREVVAEQASARRVRMLAAAAQRQLPWVVLEESGSAAGDPFFPYRRLEASVTTGQALLVTASPSEDFRSTEHAVVVMDIDVATGRVEEPDTADSQRFRCSTADDREAHVTALRSALERSG